TLVSAHAPIGWPQGLVLAAQIVRELVERGMQVRAVEALVVVLDDQLPVRLDVIDDAVAQTEILHAPRSEFTGKVGELGRERLWARIEIEEDVSVPLLRADAVQRVVLTSEVGHLVHVRRANQSAVEVIGPRVIRALDAVAKNNLR